VKLTDVAQWNQTQAYFPDECVHELFERQAASTPLATALVFGDQQLTYQELNERANQVAHYLRRRGVKPEILVGVSLHRTPLMVIGLLGVWKAGGAYVPLDPTYPSDRLAFMAQDAAIRVLLTDQKALGLFTDVAAELICLDADWDLIERESRANPATDTNPANLAYVIYTSGSTGKPKGALIVHSGLVNYLWWAIQAYGVKARGSVPVHSSISFDLTVTSLYPALLAGAWVDLLPESAGAQDLIANLRLAKKHILVKITPAHLDLLTQLAAPDEAREMTDAFIIGGENLTAESLQFWRSAAPATRLINEYGPTETVVGCCVHEVAAEDPQNGSVPIGRPIANTELYVLDEALQPVPVGTMGELYIGGAGVARGYLNRPELTRERFLPDPFSGRPAGRLYKTGDLARYRSNGILEYLGRVDNQVKIRGYRIELGEIEETLAAQPLVQSSAVVVREDTPGDKQLAAYIVARPGQPPAVEDLRRALKDSLPEYMVPTRIVLLESMPLTQNGKIDRKTLCSLASAPSVVASAGPGVEMPRTETEKTLAAIWAELLKLEAIGIHEDFFDIGGHSLMAVKAESRIRDVFAVNLPTGVIFENSTIAGLSTIITAAKGAGGAVLRIEKRSEAGPCELSFGQEQIWFLQQLLPASPAYNVVDVVTIDGSCDSGAMQRALQELAQRHDVLRTAFRMIQGRPMQVVLAEATVGLDEHDLSNLPASDREQNWMRLAQDQGRHAFDLSAPPLLRATLVHMSPAEHRLLIVIHHIVADEWSMEILQRDVKSLYRAISNGHGASLPALPIQYADFASWQKQPIRAELLREQLSYWQQKIAGASTVLDLPIDKPRPAAQSLQGGTETFAISPQLAAQLAALAREEQSTLFMMLEATFVTLLHRYSRQRDILVGTPITLRTQTETENLIGYFLNTLVLRARIDDGMTFRSLLQQVRETALAAFAHRELSFGRLVTESGLDRPAGRSPLFQAMFIMHNPDSVSLVSRVGDRQELETGTSKFELSLIVSETAGGLEGLFEYSSDLFEPASIRRMCGQYVTLLQAVAIGLDLPISLLPILSADDWNDLKLWNNTDAAYPADHNVCQFLQAGMLRAPDRVAVHSGGVNCRAGELEARSNQLARLLRSRGIARGCLVGIAVERGIDMMVALLAVLKSGAAYVPLDPAYPAERLSLMAEDASIALLITDTRNAGLFAWPEALTVVIGSDAEASGKLPAGPLPADGERDARPEDAAYVIYTSGSTGKPKGVCVPHRAVVNFLVSAAREPGLTAGDRLVAVTTLSFDIAVLELLLPLSVGAEVIVASREQVLDGQALRVLLESTGANVMQATPSGWRMLVGAGWQGTNSFKALIGGEALPVDLANQLLARTGELWNAYGPTETTIWSTFWRVRHPELGVSIGRPIANTSIWILDEMLQPCPVGVPGEICIGGSGVTLGYLGRAELTAERFIADPFSGERGGKLYRTGDRGRWRHGGLLEHMGRLDDQVKIRGYRVELGEIEALLGEHPDVRQAAVHLWNVSAGDVRIVACCVPSKPGALAAVDLRKHLRERLPAYMIPQHFLLVQEIPLTANGKVDRRRLPTPEQAAIQQTAYAPPRTPTEELLAGIWAAVLNLERVGIHDNFFELGGHSLLAVSVVERMRQALLKADVRSLFLTPTIAELATAVAAESDEIDVPPNLIPADCMAITPAMLTLVKLSPEEIARVAAAVPGGAANIQDIYPLAPLQEGLLFHHLLTSEGDLYIVETQFAFDTRERLDRYLQAMQWVVDRNDITRTAFLWEGLQEPIQVVCRRAPLIVTELSLDATHGDVAQQLSARFNLLNQRMDLSVPPPIRIYIAHDTARGRWIYHELSHHVMIDQATSNILEAEIQAYLQGRAEQLPPPRPFRDYVARTRLGVSLREHEAFFRKLLGDVDQPTAPFGFTDVLGNGSRINEARVFLESSLAQRLRETGQMMGVSTASLFHLAWALVLARLSGREDVVFATVLLGRMSAGPGANLVPGPCINTLPVRIPVGDASVRDSVRQTHNLLAQILRHEHAPLGLAQRCSAVPNNLPVFTSILNYRRPSPGMGRSRHGNRDGDAPTGGEPDSDWLFEEIEGREFLRFVERTNYPLTLSVDDYGSGFRLVAQVQSPIDPQSICNYMRAALEQLAGALASAPSVPVRKLDIMPGAERDQLLTELNATRVDYPRETLMHEPFEAQARRAPGRTAVRFGAMQLSYAELDERANRLAHALRSRGVGRGQRVGLCVERGTDMIAAMMGILKTGAAYVPLDPSFPQERLSFMVQDAQPALLVSTSDLAEPLGLPREMLLLLDADAASIAAAPRASPPIEVRVAQPEDPAYVIYTSGSTGRPKGVVIPHRAVVNFLTSMAREPGLDADDILVAVTTFSFDIAVLELQLPLMLGGAVVIASREETMDGQALKGLLERHRATVMQATPVTWRLLLEAGWNGGGAFKALVGGEALPRELADALLASGVELWNMYGPTETTVWSTCTRVTNTTDGITIGRPIANTVAYVLDGHQNLCPIEVAGELYVGGDGVALGYWRRPELTADRFLPDPFSATLGARLYRTGDRARWRGRGELEHMGRLDFQIKVRGFRIEPGDIEAPLVSIPGVRSAVVVAREVHPGDQRLVAYFLSDGTSPPDSELRSQLRRTLPEYMVPQHFVQLDSFPLQPNGKLDRGALPPPEQARRPDNTTAGAAQLTPAEEAIAKVWREVLGVAHILPGDNFFDLGGHSMMSMRAIALLEERTGHRFTPRQFVLESLRQMADAVARAPDHIATSAPKREKQTGFWRRIFGG
jgi:amino acid adenylation domain-containing protein